MKVLHFAENSTGVEVVELLAYKTSLNNSCSVIKTDEGKILQTGGHIIPYNKYVKDVLETIPADKLFMFLLNIKMKACSEYVAEYYAPENEYKRGDVIVAKSSWGNRVTEGKKYVVINDTRTGPSGNMVCILTDDGGVNDIFAHLFEKEVYYRD